MFIASLKMNNHTSICKMLMHANNLVFLYLFLYYYLLSLQLILHYAYIYIAYTLGLRVDLYPHIQFTFYHQKHNVHEAQTEIGSTLVLRVRNDSLTTSVDAFGTLMMLKGVVIPRNSNAFETRV